MLALADTIVTASDHVVAPWHKWLTLAMLAIMLVGLVRNLAPPDVVFMGGLVVVAVAGVIDPHQAFAGLSNQGLITVGALFIVAAGLRETGALHMLVSRLLGQQSSPRAALTRMTFPAAAISGFMNNTPIVAMLLPEVLAWCRKRRISPSKMLIPLSYATMLGGMCTLIGTSTNLVVNGMMLDSGMGGLSLFELAWVGVPLAMIAIGLLVTVGIRILPDRMELLARLGEARREYIVEMTVQSNCPLVGKSVQDAGLRQLHGLFLIEIDRESELISPVSPSEVLEANDRLVFTGVVQTIVELQRIPGLVPAAEKHYGMDGPARRQRRMCEAVVSGSFPGLGQSIRTSGFRTRYDAVVVAVHRNGQRLKQKIGDIVLMPGDTLLLQTGEHFEETFRGNTDFYLVSEVQDSSPVLHDRAWHALGVLALLIGLLFSRALAPALAALLCAGLAILLRCVPLGVARRSVDWQVLVVIAAALGFGEAIRSSGLADLLAHNIVSLGQTVGGAIGVLVAIYVLTNVLTEVMTHIGAAAVVFPIALAAAKAMGDLDPRPFVIALTIAASASFATPIGYQTNLMVYGPGGYRFSDFLRIGVPMNLLCMIIAVILIPLFWPL